MKEFTCIVCPRGCRLKIDDNLNVTGNSCIRGEKYAKEEMTAPKRMITTSVRVSNRKYTLVSVKTTDSIPKEKMFEVMNEINKLKVKAPINVGDVIAKNFLSLNVDLIATKNIK